MHGHLNIKLVEYVVVCCGALSVVKCAVPKVNLVLHLALYHVCSNIS